MMSSLPFARPLVRPSLRRGCRLPVALAWIGLALGLTTFGTTVAAAPAVEHRMLAGARIPAPEEITAYTVAICGALVTTVNTLLLVWHKLSERKHRDDWEDEHDGEGEHHEDKPASPAC